MQVEHSASVNYELLHSATLVAKQRFQDALSENDGSYAPLMERVALLKKYGTIRIGLGRESGNTTAAINFANTFFESNLLRTIYFGPCPDKYREMGAEEAFRWTDTAEQDPTDISAIFVDPGPHAGMQAQRAIYTFASEAMLGGSDGLRPVFIYFIGS